MQTKVGRMGMALVVCLGISIVSALAMGTERVIYVNNVTGNDAFDGLSAQPCADGKSGPFFGIQHALDAAQTSDRIEVANTGKPYRGGNLLFKGGTAERPLVIDGHGATISGLDTVSREKWKTVKEGVVATPFWPMSNLLKSYDKIQYWIGSPQIWWLDGDPARNCKSEEELLSVEGGFFWNKPKKELWVHLPSGKRLDEVRIQIPVHGTCLAVGGNDVVVKNFRGIFSSNDGFDGASGSGGKGVVFQNCVATDNCGQGFSCHSQNRVLYEDCLAERNASSGSCDVNFSSTTYRRCVFVNNTFEAGIYATEYSQHVYEDCLILGNEPFEQLWLADQPKMNFVNCVILGKKGEGPGILGMPYGGGGTVLFYQCTIADAPFVYEMPAGGHGTVSIMNSILGRCGKHIVSVRGEAQHSGRAKLDHNVYFDSPGLLYEGKLHGKDDPEALPFDRGSTWMDPQLEGPLKVILPEKSPLREMGLLYGRAVRVGAELPKSVWDLYFSTRGAPPAPDKHPVD